jgi:hypothetical protein
MACATAASDQWKSPRAEALVRTVRLGRGTLARRASVPRRASCVAGTVAHRAGSAQAYTSGTAASGDSTRNVKLSCKYSRTVELECSS